MKPLRVQRGRESALVSLESVVISVALSFTQGQGPWQKNENGKD